MKKKIYFAHPFRMKGSIGECEIITMLQLSGYEVIDPFEDEKVILHQHGVENYYDRPNKIMASQIYRRDHEHVMTCDELFAWFPKEVPCIGTAIELEWAYCANKYTYVFSPVKHPFLWSMTDFLYTSWEQLKKEFKGDAKYGG